MKKTTHRVDSGLLGGSEKATKSKLMAGEGTQLAGCLLSYPLGGYKQHPHGLCLAEITQREKKQKPTGLSSSRGRILVWVSKYFILQLTKTKEGTFL